VLAQFTNRNNDDAYLGTNIPGNTISNLFPKQSVIKKVVQAYPSFGGQQKEADSKIYVRTAERLRHKGRGVTAWDYENIILEKFPNIYKVKVLHHACPHSNGAGATTAIVAKSGSVIVLVLPKTNAGNSLYKPMISKAKLTEVYEYIKPLASPFTKLTVINPIFETINISLTAYFITAIKDRAVYEKRLRADLQRYFSPWAFDSDNEPDFGGIIYRNAVVGFVESLPYVDYVQQLTFTGANAGASPESIAASSPASILISGSMSAVFGMLQNIVTQTSNTQTIAYC
jgi:hypothetical protein